MLQVDDRTIDVITRSLSFFSFSDDDTGPEDDHLGFGSEDDPDLGGKFVPD